MFRKSLQKLAQRTIASSSSSSAGEPYEFAALKNGLKVVTNPLPNHFTALGVYINAGSRFEQKKFEGVSHLVDKLAFGPTKNYPGSSMMENLESLGGNFMCMSSRESMLYQASTFNKDTRKMLELMSETIKNPIIDDEIVEMQKQFTAYEVEELWKKPDSILPALFHIVAYNGETLGAPLLCPKERIPEINAALIREYRDVFYNPETATVAFIGVPLQKAVEMAEEHFGTWQTKNPQGLMYKPDPAVYHGGEFTLEPSNGNSEFSYLHLGFEGLSTLDPDIYALAILQTLLGGGGSFSAGGPGKGMYAKLYTQVLNKYGFIDNCTAFNYSYADSGLFGISSACIPNGSPYLVEILCQQFAFLFQKTSGPGSITETELKRSKNQLKSSLLMNLESKMVELEDLGRQVQVHGKKIALSEMISKVDEVTIQDMRRVAEKVLTGNASANGSGRPTVVIQGDREKFGDINKVLNYYGLGKADLKTSHSVKGQGPKKSFWW